MASGGIEYGCRSWITSPGGREVFSQPDAQGVYPAHWSSRAVLVRVSSNPVRYERRLPDGGVEVYAASDGGPDGQRRVFLTELIDPLDQRLQFTWDAQLRLVAITDAVGQVTTLTYADVSDPLRITRITDPFGRVATLTYHATGQLASITDVMGMTSSFTYGANDFVTTLTTPYGTTAFRHERDPLNHINLRFIEATDPLGGTEHLEFQYQTATLVASEPANEVPAGFAAWNADLNRYNTFYWSKRAWMLGPGDPSQAEVTHWMTKEEWQGWQSYSAVPHSVKRPLESRVWYAYPGQAAGQEYHLGWFTEPSRVGRVLDDGTSQVYETTYNLQGSVLSQSDPLGRQTSYTYAADGVTLTEVRQTGNGANDVLATFGNFTALEQPQTVTDAAGQVTSFTYNAAGQPLTVTNAKGEPTTYAYDTNGRVSSITGPIGGAVTSFTYDALGRQRTVTDPDGAVLTFEYDALDRVVRTIYPDGTDSVTTYARLDVASQRDREGRITRFYYDAVRRLTATRDPLGRTVTQNWCICGGLDALIDAKGNRTRWERDLQGRVTREVRADDVTDTTYTYGARSGRLLTVTDPKAQVTTYTYAADNQVLSTTFTNAVIPTPTVSFTYEAAYPRVATMQDGIGTTTYTYHPAGQLGAGQVASVDGPLTNDTLTYAYDALGRVTTRAINGAANTVTWAFDALGRVTSEANVLGTFTYGYDGPTSRVASVAYPNGQTSTYSYFGNSDDRRLQTIHHKFPDGTTLSKFDYTYSADGDILTWRQQAGVDAVLWSYVYDTAGQLLGAEKATADAVPTLLKRYAYTYDPAGNRTSEQIDDVVVRASYDGLNRLVSQQPGGPLVFAGTTNEPARVMVNGKVVSNTAGNTFQTQVPVGSGTSTVTVAATDPSGNTASQAYEVDSNGSGRSFTYDANGNLTSDGTRTFEWDARNQLVAVSVGAQRSEFGYDGLQRRAQKIDKENGSVKLERKVIWCDRAVCEERTVTGPSADRRLFLQGEQTSGAVRFFVLDHLASVSEVTDLSGLLLARYSYDLWGRRSVTDGIDVTDVGFTGHQWHQLGALWLTHFRAYDADIGRWVSEDPLRLRDGTNMYSYVGNGPIVAVDPFGLAKRKRSTPPSRTRLCDAEEYLQCVAICGSKGVESCRVSQTFRVTRATQGKILREWKDGPLSCSCKEPQEPVCGPKCQKVTQWIFVVGAAAAALLRQCMQLAPAG
jgi:RHS repeat-associated protein